MSRRETWQTNSVESRERIVLTGDIWAANLELTLVGIFDDPDHNEWLFFDHDYLRESLAPSTQIEI